MIFEGTKAKEVLDALAPFSEEVLSMGFFDEMDPSVAKPIATFAYQLDELDPQLVP